jgi:chromosome segregation ATPase
MPISDNQLDIITNLISVIVGAGSAKGAEWLFNRKSKSQKEDEHSENAAKVAGELNKASGEIVEAALKVNDMLEERLAESRVDVTSLKAEIIQIRDACNQQITAIREEYRSQMETLRSENEKLNRRVNQLTADNQELNIQVVKLTGDNTKLSKQVTDLKKRLGKYETEMTDTGNHRAIRP